MTYETYGEYGSYERGEPEPRNDVGLATRITAAVELLRAALAGGDTTEVLDRFEAALADDLENVRVRSAEDPRPAMTVVDFSFALLESVAAALAGVADQCGEAMPTADQWRINVGGVQYLTCAHAPPHTRMA